MLSFEQLTIKYAERSIINNISGCIKKGELVALIGENGAGKSTLLHALAGQKTYQGSVLLHQKDVRHYAPNELAKQRAVLMQSHHLPFAFTVEDIVAMGRFPYVESNLRCQQKVAHYISKMDLTHLRQRPTTHLSGGEQQRVHMARTLAQLNAFSDNCYNKLILLDEPTSALDLRHQHALLSCVKEFVTQGNSAIIAIHDLNLASLYADKVILLHQGKILKHGSVHSVFQQDLLQQVYDIPMFVQPHPHHHVPMIFSEPRSFQCETSL